MRYKSYQKKLGDYFFLELFVLSYVSPLLVFCEERAFCDKSIRVPDAYDIWTCRRRAILQRFRPCVPASVLCCILISDVQDIEIYGRKFRCFICSKCLIVASPGKFKTINNVAIALTVYSTMTRCCVMNRFVFLGILPGVEKVSEHEKIKQTSHTSLYLAWSPSACKFPDWF